MKVTIRRDNDPFKKYWWVLLLAFGLVGAWICLPLLSGDGQQAGASASGGGMSSEQSLDSAQNPNGATGGVIDLSMESSGRRKKDDGSMASGLYQASEAPGAAAPGLALTDATSANPSSLADALKGVSEKKVDESGWGGKKAQKGFTAPAARFGGLSGLGSTGGGGSGGTAAHAGAFGTSVANTGLAATRGLQGGGQDSQAGGSPAMSVLKGASKAGMAAASNKSNDAAAAGVGRSFDGGRGGGAIGGGENTGAGGLYAGLDAAPSNLKANRTDLDHFEIKDVPAKPVGDMDTGDDLKKKLMMLLVGAVVGGMVGGVAGTAIMMAISSVSDERSKEGKSGSDVAGQTSGKGK